MKFNRPNKYILKNKQNNKINEQNQTQIQYNTIQVSSCNYIVTEIHNPSGSIEMQIK